ncbi:MAG: hypothetical protein VB778_01740 [Nitrospinaceae bacterium]
MIIDRFIKFSLSILAFSLCLNALNPWLSPTLANAEIEDTEVKNAMKIIAQGFKKMADVYEKQLQRNLRQDQLDLIRYEKQEQQNLRQHQLDLMQRAQIVRAGRKLVFEDTE